MSAPPNGDEPLVKIGTVLGGKYRVERVIAEGGMGIVVRAVNIDLGSKVAVKVLQPALRDDETAFIRFVQEARGVAKLQSEHIVQMIDVSAQEREMPYMVMELLDGQDLDAMVQVRGSLPCGTAVDFIRQACLGVGVAHKAGILHRDLKPANLFLARKPGGAGAVVKVLDFGLMKIKPGRGEDVKITRPKDVFGSPSYMSPEQISAEILDERTDVWSLGAILFELITGRSAFGAETIAQTLVNISIHHPPLMATFVDDVPVELEEIVKKCLEKDRADRYASVEELSAALKPYANPSDGAAALLPERGMSLPPPPPAPGVAGAAGVAVDAVGVVPLPKSGDTRADTSGDTAGLEMPNSRRRITMPRIETIPASSLRRTRRTVYIAIAAGALIGGVMAALLTRGGSNGNNGTSPSASVSSTLPSARPQITAQPLPSSEKGTDIYSLPLSPSATAPHFAPPHPNGGQGTQGVALPQPTPDKPTVTASPLPPPAPPTASPSLAPYPEYGRRK